MDSPSDSFQNRFFLFKNQYENFVASKQTEILSSFQQKYTSFSNSYQIVKKLVDEIEQKKASEFNVFSIWGVGHLEAVTHTPFLAELLNPVGSHGQKELFLTSFLKQFTLFSEEEINSSDWKVICEKERVDLRIVNYRLMKAVFIENKVYSDAHSGQLSRYYKIFEEQFNCNGKFIYLSIEGDYPNKEGFDSTIYPEEKMDFDCLSYRPEILNWLVKTQNCVQASKVRHSLIQYIDLIQKRNWR